LVAVTVGLFVAACAQILVYHQQRRIMARQNDISVATQRAFVFIEEFKYFRLHDLINEQRIVQWRFVPRWANSGSTIARKMRMFASWQPFVPDIPTTFDFPDVGITRNIPITPMGPRSTVNGALHLEIPVYLLVAVKEGSLPNLYVGME
jgi:hypothetical protein